VREKAEISNPSQANKEEKEGTPAPAPAGHEKQLPKCQPLSSMMMTISKLETTNMATFSRSDFTTPQPVIINGIACLISLPPMVHASG